MKKILKIMLCIFTFTFILGVNAEAKETDNSSTSIETMQQYLIDAGLSERIVISMSDTIVTEWYNRIQGKKVAFSEVEESLHLINNDTVNEDGISMAVNIPEDELEMFTFYCNYLSEQGTVELVEAGVYVGWLTVPYFQNTDAMTVNWDSDLFVLSSMYALVSNRVGDTYYDVATITRPNTQVQGGYGFTFPLKKGNMAQAGYPGLEVIMTLEPAVVNSISPNTPIKSNINFNYAHTTVAVLPNISFSISDGVVGFDILQSYDEASDFIIYDPSHENIDYGNW